VSLIHWYVVGWQALVVAAGGSSWHKYESDSRIRKDSSLFLRLVSEYKDSRIRKGSGLCTRLVGECKDSKDSRIRKDSGFYKASN
jgi:hypothetical protein